MGTVYRQEALTAPERKKVNWGALDIDYDTVRFGGFSAACIDRRDVIRERTRGETDAQ